MDDILVHVGLKGVVEKEGKILFLKHSKGGYDLPGGKIKHINDFEKELKREIKEETALEVSVGKPFAVWGHPYAKRPIVLIGFRCEWVSGEVVLSNEHESYEWLGKEDLKKIPKEWKAPIVDFFE